MDFKQIIRRTDKRGGAETRMKIRCSNAADQDALVVILAKNGYTVWQMKGKVPGKGISSYYAEIVEDGI